ncbi:MAG: tetratricopeptide repeat protein [Roseovarius sp.]
MTKFPLPKHTPLNSRRSATSRIHNVIWLCGLSLLTLGAPAQAQQTDTPVTMAEIEQAWKAGDYVFVRDGLQQLAEQTGTALAQYRYGRVLAMGRGGPKDLPTAVTWLTRAADQNHAESLTLLARIYLSNLPQSQDEPTGLERDPAKAADLLTRAAALGHAEAQYHLSLLYATGDGVNLDDTTAFTWMLAAARQEYFDAQYELSRFYARGTGTDTNAETALEWLERAASNNHVKAQYYLALNYEAGNGVAQSLPAAISWYRRAAENGLPIAQRNLGTYYLKGEGIAQNTEEGLRWLNAAAKAGDAGAMANLGMAYATGLGVEKNDATAANWYNRASEYGLGRAKVALGTFYEVGRGVDQDVDRAIALYEQTLETTDAGMAARQLARMAAAGTLEGRIAPQRAIPWALYAAEQGDDAPKTWLATQADAGLRDAQAGLAVLYLKTDETAAEGARLLDLAATAGDAAAQARLGEMYMTGAHVELDYIAAHKWFNIAATLGQSRAVELRETVSALMTPEDVAEAQAAARHWFENEEPQPPAIQQNATIVSE